MRGKAHCAKVVVGLDIPNLNALSSPIHDQPPPQQTHPQVALRLTNGRL